MNTGRFQTGDQMESRPSEFLVPNEVRISLKGNFKG